MHKNIIPGLVSFDTTLSRLSGCYISADFDAYPPIAGPNPFHYTLSVDKRMAFTSDYAFRHQYFYKSGSTWYYERRVPPGIPLKLRYDGGSRTFRFNEALKLMPFSVGGIIPAGGHISDMIALDLLLAGYMLLRGSAVAFGDRAALVVGPGFNGKTSFMARAIEAGAKYVADEVLVVDIENRTVFPVSLAGNLGRSANMKLRRDFKEGSKALAAPVRFEKVFMIQNFRGGKTVASPDKSLLDYIYMLSLCEFYGSSFASAFAAEEGLTAGLFERFEKMKDLDWDCSFVRINDYDFGELLEDVKRACLAGAGRAESQGHA
jgi:hypothetical protein